MGKTICYFDLETDSLELDCQIIQLAAVAMESGKVVGSFEAKLLFDITKSDPQALLLNGYDAKVWQAEAKTPESVCRAFVKWLNNFKCKKMISKTGNPFWVAQLSGYNCAVFDAPRLQALFKRLGLFLPASYMVLDVFQKVMYFYEGRDDRPKDLKLKTVCAAHGIPLLKAHDALEDVTATGMLDQKFEVVLTVDEPFDSEVAA